jgi:UrcA family protein
MLLAALASGALIQPAAAQETVTQSIVVKLADLDLSSPAGAKSALTRIRSAAHEVCEPEATIVDIRETVSYGACVADAERHAVSTLDRPEVTALFESRRGNKTVQFAQNGAH